MIRSQAEIDKEPKWGPATKEIGLDADGKVCESTDKKCQKLLVGVNQFLPWSVAVEHGLAEPLAALPRPAPPVEGLSVPGNASRNKLDMRGQKTAAKGAKSKAK